MIVSIVPQIYQIIKRLLRKLKNLLLNIIKNYINKLKERITKFLLIIKIENYDYHYKYYNINKTKVTFRWKYPNVCKVYIQFDLSKINKIIDNKFNNNTIIEYTKINKNIHTCKDKDEYINSKKIFI